ncbi:MAG: YbaB/EbfC family nucleoid-associated protein [Candidatus Falkowbacteria bacterium]|nr:YbaB/EbfC family nucleoid-associated protein [Candidatus Falkowbacteria bacterium]
MFNKLKQYKDLRSQAKMLQNMMAQETITIERNGIKITINGNFEITALNILEEKSKESLEKVLTECFNEATKKIQRVVAEKMQGMGGLPQF